jgi:hypothetical protein
MPYVISDTWTVTSLTVVTPLAALQFVFKSLVINYTNLIKY